MSFLGVAFDRVDMAAALDWAGGMARSSRFGYLVTPNADHVVRLSRGGKEPWVAAFRHAVTDADLCLNDSRILARLAGLSGLSLPPVPGSDLTRELILSGRIAAGTVVLLIGGAEPEFRWLRTALPDCRVEHLQPPMGVRDNPAEQLRIAEFVESHRAGIIFLALGSPQSEIVAYLIRQRGSASGVCLCIGASIEFLSGTRRRAPLWMRRASLEWLHRLVTEPRRLWRRYLVESPRVLLIWWRRRRR